MRTGRSPNDYASVVNHQMSAQRGGPQVNKFEQVWSLPTCHYKGGWDRGSQYGGVQYGAVQCIIGNGHMGPPQQNDRQTPVKILPSRIFVNVNGR